MSYGQQNNPDRFLPWQVAAIAVCVGLQVLDGLDIFVMSAVAPKAAHDLRLDAGALGLVFSAGLVGMTIGALLLSGLADRYGRRPTILLCLCLDTAGMLLAGLSHSLDALVVARLVTGLGVGGIMPVLNTTVAELCPARLRNLIISIQSAGYPAGGFIAALLAAVWLPRHSWSSLFLLAAVPSLLGMAATYFLVREPPIFVAARTGLAQEKGFGSFRRVFRVARSGLVLFALLTFSAQFSFYFFTSWLPTILAPHLSGSMANAPALALNLGGMVGDAVFAILSPVWGRRRMSVVFLLLGAASACSIALAPSGSLVIVLALLLGGALFASMAGIYATAPAVFPPLVRAAGTGIAFSLGRFGGAISPSFGALLMRPHGIGLIGALLAMTLPLVVAALLFPAVPEQEA